MASHLVRASVRGCPPRVANARCRAASEGNKTNRYNEVMAEKMAWGENVYEYDFSRGLYYHHIMQDSLLCGSQPTCADDVLYLAQAEKVDTIVSLQQPKDPEYWGVDVGALHHAMDTEGVHFHRVQTVDFDADSLRATLPDAVHVIAKNLADNKKVYVHCTAGLGRAPAACIAYLFWFQQYTLDEAYEHLTKIRPCGPKKDSIRGATYDILAGGDWDAFASLPPHAYSSLNDEDRYMLQYHILQERK